MSANFVLSLFAVVFHFQLMTVKLLISAVWHYNLKSLLIKCSKMNVRSGTKPDVYATRRDKLWQNEKPIFWCLFWTSFWNSVKSRLFNLYYEVKDFDSRTAQKRVALLLCTLWLNLSLIRLKVLFSLVARIFCRMIVSITVLLSKGQYVKLWHQIFCINERGNS